MRSTVRAALIATCSLPLLVVSLAAPGHRPKQDVLDRLGR